MDFSNGIAAPANWRNSSIGEVCTIFTSGGTPSRKRADFYSDGDIPWVKTQELQDRVIISSDEHITKDGLANSSAKLLPQETVLMAMYGATVGRLGILGIEATCNQASAAMCVDRELAEYRFLFYLLKTHRERIIEQASGGAQQNLSGKQIKDFRFNFPPVSEQEAIAEILWSLDQVIWKNEETAATLESIAQTLFRSWFVDFDPVRAKMRGEKPVGMDDATAALFPESMEESELGEIPAGWMNGTLGDVIEIHDSRRVPLSSDQRRVRSGTYPYYGATGIVDRIDGFLFSGPHVLVGEDGTVMTTDGKPIVQYVWGDFWVNNHAHVLSGKGFFSVEYVKTLIAQLDIRIFITGAVQLKLNQANLRSVPVTLPPQDILKAFDQVCLPLFTLYRELQDQIATLTEIRDSLLPRLVSGELQIPDDLVA